MDSKHVRVKLAEDIAKEWDREKISYSVVHGLHDYPDKLGRDLDIVIDRRSVFKACSLAQLCGARYGFDKTMFRWSHWGLFQFALVDTENSQSLPLDFMCTTDVWRAKWIRMVDDDVLDRLVLGDSRRGPFCVSTEGVFLKACVRPLLCGDLSRFESEFLLPVDIPKEVDLELLVELVGPYGKKLLDCPSMPCMEKEYPNAIRVLQGCWVRKHYWEGVLSLFDAIKGRLLRLLFNAADVILLRTTQPEETLSILNDMVPEMKQMFVDLMPVMSGSRVMGKLSGYAVKWRPVPVSEFRLTVAVEDSKSKEEQFVNKKAVVRPGRGRIALGPDSVVELSPDLNLDEIRTVSKKCIMNYIFAKYSLKSVDGSDLNA